MLPSSWSCLAGFETFVMWNLVGRNRMPEEWHWNFIAWPCFLSYVYFWFTQKWASHLHSVNDFYYMMKFVLFKDKKEIIAGRHRSNALWVEMLISRAIMINSTEFLIENSNGLEMRTGYSSMRIWFESPVCNLWIPSLKWQAETRDSLDVTVECFSFWQLTYHLQYYAS